MSGKRKLKENITLHCIKSPYYFKGALLAFKEIWWYISKWITYTSITMINKKFIHHAQKIRKKTENGSNQELKEVDKKFKHDSKSYLKEDLSIGLFRTRKPMK
jgi:hypothetical protein